MYPVASSDLRDGVRAHRLQQGSGHEPPLVQLKERRNFGRDQKDGH